MKLSKEPNGNAAGKDDEEILSLLEKNVEAMLAVPFPTRRPFAFLHHSHAALLTISWSARIFKPSFDSIFRTLFLSHGFSQSSNRLGMWDAKASLSYFRFNRQNRP
jgi:hypothetical protein